VVALALFGLFKITGRQLNSNWSTPLIAIIFIGLNTWATWLVRKEKVTTASVILVTELTLLGAGLISFWGYDLPSGLLIIILGVVVAGIAFGARSFLVAAISAVSIYVFLSILQVSKFYVVTDYWKLRPDSYADIVIYAVTMAVIFAVTWLFNRQLHAAYLKSRASEEALREQSEHLEELVVQRTEALRQEHYQRVADLHRFVLYGKEASGLLHDILNPLTALGLQLSNLKRRSTDRTHLAQAEATLQRLEQLVTGARRHMRREIEPESFSFHSEIKMVFQSVQHRARKNHVKLEVTGEDITLFTDPILIYKIFQNLVVNGLDACLLVPEKHNAITIHVSTDDTTVRFSVHDSGIGMTKKQVEQAFTPYFTTKKRDEGAGIGLSLTKELIEELGGSISLTSKLKVGTTVTIILPKHVVTS
jgi:signal transduction histidine kinase